MPEGGEGGCISGRDTCQDERDRKDLMIGRRYWLRGFEGSRSNSDGFLGRRAVGIRGNLSKFAQKSIKETIS